MTYNLEGKRFGRLVARAPIPGTASQSRKWSCLCDCGNVVARYTARLNDGSATSCGCAKGSARITYYPRKFHHTNVVLFRGERSVVRGHAYDRENKLWRYILHQPRYGFWLLAREDELEAVK